MRKPTRAQVIGSVALLAGVGVVVLLAAIGMGFVAPGGCEGCHLQDDFGEASSASAHASVECLECHAGGTPVSRVSFAGAHAFGMVVRVRGVDPAEAAIQSARCRDCHEEVFEAVVESQGLRVSHASCASEIECTQCHSTTAHGDSVSWPRTASMEMCLDCHVEEGATTKCDACHAARLPNDRVTSGTFAVTHGPDYLQTHGMGDMGTCAACHGPDKCVKCHGAGVPHVQGFIGEHRKAAGAANADCNGCHVEPFCIDCHGYEMPHPEEFTLEHAAVVERDGDSGCGRCHPRTDCDQCHEKHVHPTTLEQLRELGVPVPEGGLR